MKKLEIRQYDQDSLVQSRLQRERAQLDYSQTIPNYCGKKEQFDARMRMRRSEQSKT